MGVEGTAEEDRKRRALNEGSLRARRLLCLVLAVACSPPAAARADTAYTILHAFQQPLGFPRQLTPGRDGNLYGITTYGEAGWGSVFKIDSSNTVTRLHEFRGEDGANPLGALVQGRDGLLYGTTSAGGPFGAGTIFKVDSAGTFTSLHSFNRADGTYPQAKLLQGSDGAFYGTTIYGGASGDGTVFRVDSAGAFAILHGFAATVDGAHPYAGVVEGTDGAFYGVTFDSRLGPLDFGGGTVFKIDEAGTFTSLHSFDYSGGTYGDGAHPFADLVPGRDGALYGTTSDDAAVFKIDSAGRFTLLHKFDASEGFGLFAGVVQGSDGAWYGTTFGRQIDASELGTIFRVDTGGTFTTLHRFNSRDGAYPVAGLVVRSGVLFGTTLAGGTAGGAGTVFTIDQAGTFAPVASFGRDNDGKKPTGELIQGSNGAFYGTTDTGGTYGQGTIFEIDRAGTFTTLHSFNFADGANPSSGVVQGSDGALYGTTFRGGTYRVGTVFKIDSAGIFTSLHSFNYLIGVQPSGLVQGSDGAVYGVTLYGGASGAGMVFKIDSSGTFTSLHEFSFSDGTIPSSGLVQRRDGSLYGTTIYGGAFGPPNGYGTVFKIDSTGTFTTLHDFNSSDGANPNGRLVQGADGAFYGTTLFGGTSGGGSGYGTVFRIDGAGNFTSLHGFNFSDGGTPDGEIVQGRDGAFYGTTLVGGTFFSGTVFKVDGAGQFTSLHSFVDRDEGASPQGNVVEGRDGAFYGTTSRSGMFDAGSIFRVDSRGMFGVVHTFNDRDGSEARTGMILGADGALYGMTQSGGFGSGVVFRVATE